MAKLYSGSGGHIILPNPGQALVSREAGGNLIVIPPRDIWERSELSPAELTSWCFLVAATGRAMLDVLPQLQGGCINYWEAGNWSLNELADPPGPKTVEEHRRVHLHLLGRSKTATDPSCRWGEAPKFPDFVDRQEWMSTREPLNAEECSEIVIRVKDRLREYYGLKDQ